MLENLSKLLKTGFSFLGQVIKSGYIAISFLLSKIWKFGIAIIIAILGLVITTNTFKDKEE